MILSHLRRAWAPTLLATIFAVALGPLIAGKAAAQQPLQIGTRLEPLVDDLLIEKLTGDARQVLHHPIPREVSIDHDVPWEGNTSTYHTIFRDGDLYRMYYRGSHYDMRTNKATHKEFVCYAESDDAIHWRRPELGLVEFEGSAANNILLDGIGTHDFAPFKDANPDAPADERYKALGRGPGGLHAFKSADGIHWEPLTEGPVITEGAFDSLNLGFWDPERDCYVEFHRGFKSYEGVGRVRDIQTCTSPDFLNWTKPQFLSYTGAPPEHLYTNAVVPYIRAPHIYFGFPKRFVPGRNPTLHPTNGVSDAVFMTSRDGVNFHRCAEALIRPGPQRDNWVSRNTLPAWGMVMTRSDFPDAPEEISIYATESYYSGDSCRLRRFSLRQDGFVSVNSSASGGEMLTRPLLFGGQGSAAAAPTTLTLNFATSAAGSLRCELQTADGMPLEGFTVAECDPIYGDEISGTVSWQGKSDLSVLIGQPIRIRFVIQDADLYALQFDQ